MRFRLRTLLIVLALGPIVLWGIWHLAVWRAKRIAEHEAKQRAMQDFVSTPFSKPSYDDYTGEQLGYPPRSEIDALKRKD